MSVENALRQAKDALQKAGVSSIPVPVDRIAQSRGIAVQHMPLPDEMSGMSFIKDGMSVIVVNAGHHPNRQRFTLAHELAHHILHKEYLLGNVHVDNVVLHRNHKSSGGVDQKEIEANAFAAELLMPTAQVKAYKDVDINDDSLLLAIARRFKVSASAILYRIMNIQ